MNYLALANNVLAVGDGGLIVIFQKNTKAFPFHQISNKRIKSPLATNGLCAPCMSMTHLLSSKAKKVKNTNLFLLNKRQVK
jgi:hypothetical protein